MSPAKFSIPCWYQFNSSVTTLRAVAFPPRQYLEFCGRQVVVQNCRETLIARRRIPKYHHFQYFPSQPTSLFWSSLLRYVKWSLCRAALSICLETFVTGERRFFLLNARNIHVTVSPYGFRICCISFRIDVFNTYKWFRTQRFTFPFTITLYAGDSCHSVLMSTYKRHVVSSLCNERAIWYMEMRTE